MVVYSMAPYLRHQCHGRLFLTNGYIEAVDVGILLREDGIHAYGGLADLAVTDDQFPLTTPNGRNGVNGLDTCHHGFMYALA